MTIKTVFDDVNTGRGLYFCLALLRVPRCRASLRPFSWHRRVTSCHRSVPTGHDSGSAHMKGRPRGRRRGSTISSEQMVAAVQGLSDGVQVLADASPEPLPALSSAIDTSLITSSPRGRKSFSMSLANRSRTKSRWSPLLCNANPSLSAASPQGDAPTPRRRGLALFSPVYRNGLEDGVPADSPAPPRQDAPAAVGRGRGRNKRAAVARRSLFRSPLPPTISENDQSTYYSFLCI